MADTNESKGVVIDTATALRADVLTLEIAFKDAKAAIVAAEPLANEDRPEVMSNITLAFRHLQDARMRLGKVIQAATGGVSIYDKQAGQSDAGNSNAPAVEDHANANTANASQEAGATDTDSGSTDTTSTDSEQKQEPQEGDPCTMPDGKTAGTIVKEHDGSLVCSVAQ